MINVTVTGAGGFIGKNLIDRLRREKGVKLKQYHHGDDLSLLHAYLNDSDIIYHLAGVNRPQNNDEFESVNKGLTESIVSYLIDHHKTPKIIFASSAQAAHDNLYGLSKKAAEDVLKAYSMKTGADVCIYRLPGVFGKWCKPHYNSVVATFCHEIAHDKDIEIHDADKMLELVYIDDVIDSFIDCLEQKKPEKAFYNSINKTFHITVDGLAQKLYEIKKVRESLIIPDLSDKLTKYLYTTYLSYLDANNFSYKLPVHQDERGSLVELIKSHQAGQIFISTSRGGIVRGNHYHHTKVEKFCVLKGAAAIKLRKIDSDKLITYHVTDQNIEIIDIPPGYTHSIENVTDDEIVVMFWANELFDPDNPDTIYLDVQPNEADEKKG
ncbi:polysaccharide biosynthesis C-terminal domain-containing protein [Oceanobacillus neutriphilus]|uniref:Capsular polysaccharide biosynthesis protein Cap8F n=1 Tax=Oceanobacillus neutriphilus TaxID=531815 RepID=A0ABQ2NQE3_9BACI|nr:NAD-dependent epimerase/dehydratase family protein [Oceanobacillus neutriphilus]GGP09206.1 capsular polysaccharide biosynthesis protein Cap8F [Oceanobacillus neutriphilus]